jgi:hypothetical protein
MPRNPNLRIDLECVGTQWKFVLHRNSTPHYSTRGYESPETAVREAMTLLSLMRLAKGSAERKQRRLESIKTHGVVAAPKESEAETEPEITLGTDDI